ncbi:hypothetical protein [Tepidibacter hydrothermalis]|uniref:Uncharacterized protein n=1 Tax=Tepidibacter hydrothermalis TaxID=3036126 RepID=A0ABY8EE35_9FIRM|nr:hypothetical protein [Tepidibacter hydrothermalis]WFD09747.1 hypothetical protein P4S50_15320 [Tepidibacter hydrothermalis]
MDKLLIRRRGKQLHTLVKALDDATESLEKHLEQYDGYISMQEKKAYKNQIEKYQNVKLSIELERGNKAIVEQMG